MKKENLTVINTIQEGVEKDVEKFISYDDKRQLAFFTQTSYEKHLLARKNDQLKQELKEERDVLSMAETSPLAWKRVIKPYFEDLGITTGACIAVGKWLSGFKKYVLKTHGESYFLEKGRYAHLHNHLMYKIERSSSPYFREIRKNYRAWAEFEERMREFARVVFFRERQAVLMDSMDIKEQAAR